MAPTVIEVSRLRKTYGRTVAVDDVSFGVREEEIFGVPLVLLLILGSIPKLNQPETALGGLSFIEVCIPALLGFVITVMSVMGLPLTLATYRAQGILRRLSTTPIPPAWLLGAQLVVNLTIAVVGILILVGVAMVRFGTAVPKSSPGFILAIALTMVAIFAIGLLVAAVANGASAAQTLGGTVGVPLLFFAGLWVPSPPCRCRFAISVPGRHSARL
ncbi:MAG: ABC transporter permease [Gemmataceae bacterium]